MALEDVYITGAVRTAIGSFGGSLKSFAPSSLGSMVIAESLRRADCPADAVQHVVMGQVIQSEPRDAYLARVAAIEAGIPTSAPALTVNRLCGSGLQAVISAAQLLRLGECEVAVAGGAESMSNAPFVSKDTRWGRKMSDGVLIDALTASLTDPFGAGHMGMTAERVADVRGVDRARQDALAQLSQERAERAIAEGRFHDQILPIEIASRSEVRTFHEDEHPRRGTTAASLAKLKPAFKADGSVTAGNASGVNDGAAALTLMSGAAIKRHSAPPLARIIGWGYAGVDPQIMGLGPINAVPAALTAAGVTLSDIDVIENNEAFAAQACAVADELRFDPEKTNPNGGAIALGHPIGATGAILVVKALYELQRTSGRYGLITMCIGGGQGIALVIDRSV